MFLCPLYLSCVLFCAGIHNVKHQRSMAYWESKGVSININQGPGKVPESPRKRLIVRKLQF